MNVSEMRVLRWMCGKTRRNERIHKMIEVASIIYAEGDTAADVTHKIQT